MKIINVKHCQECPFVNNDNEYGYDKCSITEITIPSWEQMPEKHVHDKCPLKEKDITVKLQK